MPPEFSLMPRFETFNVYQNKPQIKLLLGKTKIFRLLEAPPPDPHWPPTHWSEASRLPKQPLVADFWLHA